MFQKTIFAVQIAFYQFLGEFYCNSKDLKFLFIVKYFARILTPAILCTTYFKKLKFKKKMSSIKLDLIKRVVNQWLGQPENTKQSTFPLLKAQTSDLVTSLICSENCDNNRYAYTLRKWENCSLQGSASRKQLHKNK